MRKLPEETEMIKEKIQQELIKSQKLKDSMKVSVLRMLLSELHNEEIKLRGDLTQDQILAVLRREKKKRNEAREQYQNGGRPELAEKEAYEMGVISEYLPEQIDETKLREIIRQVIAESGASSEDYGQVMGKAMAEIKGQADGALVARVVKEELNT